jgi:lipopolysaccharide exporter
MSEVPAAAATAAAQPHPATGRTARGLAKATALSLVLRVAAVLVGVVTTSLLARYLAPAGYGMLSLAVTLGTAAAQVADLGVAQAVASRIAREPAGADRVLGTGVALRTTVAVVATAVLITLALAGLFGHSGGVIAIVAIATPLSAASVLTAGATARFRPETASVLAFVQGAAWLATVRLVTAARGDVHTLAWFFVIVVVVQTVLGLGLNRRIGPVGRPSTVELRRLLSLSWPLAVSSLAVTAYYRFDSVILFHAKGAGEVGYYAAAYKLLDVAQLAPAVLVAPILPLAAGGIRLPPRHRELILSLATRTGALVGVGGALVLTVLAHPLVDVVYGRAFAPAARPLELLAAAFVFVTFGWVGTTVNTALGRVRPVAALTVPVAVVSLGAQLWACPRWGATGAAAVTAGTEFVVGVGTCVLASRAMAARLPVREVVTAVAAGAAIVLATAVTHLPAVVEGALAAVAFAIVAVVGRVVTVQDVHRVLSRRVLHG